MLLLSEIGMRLGTAAAGVGSAILAVTFGDLVMRLVAVWLAVIFLSLFTVMVVADIRERRGLPPPKIHGTGRPGAAEWVFVVVFDALMALFVYAGVLDVQRGGEGELLVAGVIAVGMVLLLTGGVVRRWWRHRRAGTTGGRR
ncbi:hypothetical protein QQY66_18005 [Streptomyces sp. DG2A-72]|uniref:hypothetical protein n=1 Tax=Streptomyces sp. DG2A-72 TaxID=3051386 RepID=UPI00265C17D0|nr:hypothetical protein [Streptomyces sp. DG2A-72]MDO0933488.1 hypothetical protein [Streptomyces sp. DG2A-72]